MAKKKSDREKEALKSMNYDNESPAKEKKTDYPFVDNSEKSTKLAQMQAMADISLQVQQAAQLKAMLNENDPLTQAPETDTMDKEYTEDGDV